MKKKVHSGAGAIKQDAGVGEGYRTFIFVIRQYAHRASLHEGHGSRSDFHKSRQRLDLATCTLPDVGRLFLAYLKQACSREVWELVASPSSLPFMGLHIDALDPFGRTEEACLCLAMCKSCWYYSPISPCYSARVLVVFQLD